MKFSFLLRPDDLGKSLTGFGPIILVLILFGIGHVVIHQFTYEGNKDKSISFYLGGNPWDTGTVETNTFQRSRGWVAELKLTDGVGNAVLGEDVLADLVYGNGQKFDSHDRPWNKHPANPENQLEELETALLKLDLQNDRWDVSNYEGLEPASLVFFDQLFKPMIDAGWIPSRFYNSAYGTSFFGYTHNYAVSEKSETLVYGLLHDDLDVHKSDRSYYDNDDTIYLFCAYSSSDQDELSRIDIYPYTVEPNIKDQKLNWDRREQLWKVHGYTNTGTNADRENHDLFQQQLIDKGWQLVSEPSVAISEYSEPNEDDELQINPIKREIRLGLWVFQK